MFLLLGLLAALLILFVSGAFSSWFETKPRPARSPSEPAE